MRLHSVIPGLTRNPARASSPGCSACHALAEMSSTPSAGYDLWSNPPYQTAVIGKIDVRDAVDNDSRFATDNNIPCVGDVNAP
jgi:hypothetical protein